MSNLSNLYISQSYYGVVNLVDSTQPFASQSQTQIQFQDGLGESLGISVTDVKDFIFDNNVVVSESLEVVGDVTASNGRFHGNLHVSGNVYAREVITTIESSSVIYSSGSNIIGDEVTDTQTIVGQTSISGSLTVIGPHSHTGDINITGSLFVSNEISSSTIAGLGNATSYSQSVDSRLDYIEGPFSSSVDSRLDELEGPFSTSVDSRLDYLEGPFSTSVDDRLDQLEADSGSQDSRLDNLELFTSSQEVKNVTLSSYTQSNDEKWDTLQSVTSSLNTFTQSADQRLDSIEAFTASLVADFVTEAEYSASIAVVTGSLINQIDTKLDTGSYLIDSASFSSRIDTKLNSSWTGSVFTPFSSSVDSRINTTNSNITSLSSSIQVTDNAQTVRIDDLASFTGSYATTGSNVFNGSQEITGSVNGNVVPITVTSQTASIDCSLGNFFTLSLPTGSTYFTATNVIPGQTISLRVATQSNTTASIDSNTIKMIGSAGYFPVQTNGIDILTFVTFDENYLYGVVGSFFG